MQQEMKKKYDKPAVNVIHANCGGFMAETISGATIGGTNNNTSSNELGTASGDNSTGVYTSKGHTILWDEEEE